jgi:hypothetical protein
LSPTRRDADLMVMRSIVELMGAYRTCVPACRRHRRCASATVACFDLNSEKLQDILEELATWRRFEGPRSPEEEARPVGEQLID